MSRYLTPILATVFSLTAILAGALAINAERSARVAAELTAEEERQSRIVALQDAEYAIKERDQARAAATNATNEMRAAQIIAATATADRDAALDLAARAQTARQLAEDSAASAADARITSVRRLLEGADGKMDVSPVSQPDAVVQGRADSAIQLTDYPEASDVGELLGPTESQQVSTEALEARAAAELAVRMAEIALQEADRNRAEAEQSLAVAEQSALLEEKERIREIARTQPLVKAVITGELRFYIEPLPEYAGEGVEHAVSDVAHSFSNYSPYNARIYQVYDESEADMSVHWVKDYGTHLLGQSIFAAHIKVALGRHNCVGEWAPFDANTVKKILWHELGHSMGYGHSDESGNIMTDLSGTRFVVDWEATRVLAGGWYWLVPFCGEGKFFYAFESENDDQGFDIDVLRPGVDPETFDSDSDEAYLNCGRNDMHRYSGSCTVEKGAMIYVRNSSDWNAIRLTGRIVDQNSPTWPNMSWDSSVFRYSDDKLQSYYDLFHP